LAAAGARIVLVGRDAGRLGEVGTELSALTGEDRYPLVLGDMSSLRSVRAVVDQVMASEQRLDIVVDNAGAIYRDRGETAEGIERTLATLVCGPFALVAGLLPMLRASRGRVIAVTSGGMYTQSVDVDDIEFADGSYNGTIAYARAKRIQVVLIREWARRYHDAGVSFNAMHPGWADTPGLGESLPTFRRVMKPLLRSAEEGADTIVWLATTPTVSAPGGRLFLDRRERPFDRAPQTRLRRDERAAVWEMVSELTARS
jgi:NAD(P)-dependent dehydrogenase (short-subunit alcohol dehydrogenase family)